jgi:hypothetical protein
MNIYNNLNNLVHQCLKKAIWVSKNADFESIGKAAKK